MKQKSEGAFLGAIMAPMTVLLIALTASSLIKPFAFSLINSVTGKKQKGGFLLLTGYPYL